MRTSNIQLIPIVLALATSAACGRAPQPAAAATLTPCRIDGLAEEIRCTSISVPEDRDRPDGRRIAIRVAVVPALARNPAPDPLVLLAGGPGQAATALAPWVVTIFSPIRRHRDIVLIDQRGTGASNPLACEDDGEGSLEQQEEASRACLAAIDGDPRHYTNAAAMEDLDEIRAALGYQQINLWGGSYGTRAALVYMRAHGDRVRSAVLDGVAPWSLQFPLYSARDGERALQRLLDDCAAAPDCARAFPALRAHLDALLQRLTASPVTIDRGDPRTAADRSIRVTREEFGASVRGFLYVTALASAVPLVIERAYAGDFQPFLALRQAVAGWSFETMSLGMTRAVLCSEDVPRIADDEIDAATKNTLVGAAEISMWRAICGPWPRASLPADHDAPVRFDGPVLVLSGDLDPVVPPRWGEEVIATMPRGRHLVAPGVGHNVTPAGCAPDLIADFIERGDASGLDARCLDTLKRPPFVTSVAGSIP